MRWHLVRGVGGPRGLPDRVRKTAQARALPGADAAPRGARDSPGTGSAGSPGRVRTGRRVSLATEEPEVSVANRESETFVAKIEFDTAENRPFGA